MHGRSKLRPYLTPGPSPKLERGDKQWRARFEVPSPSGRGDLRVRFALRCAQLTAIRKCPVTGSVKGRASTPYAARSRAGVSTSAGGPSANTAPWCSKTSRSQAPVFLGGTFVLL